MKRKLIKCFMPVMVLLVLNVPIKAQAANTYWTQDNIDVTTKQDGNHTLVLLSTQNIEKEYGYIAIQGQIKNRQKDIWENPNFAGVGVSCDLDTTAPLFMSISLADKEKNTLSLTKEAAFSKMKEENLTLHFFEEGQYKIDDSMIGNLFFPISSFEKNKKFDQENLNSYTISLVIPQNTQVSFLIGEAQEMLIEQPVFQSEKIPNIIGPSSLELPIHGESMGTYEISNPDFSIRLIQEVEGINFENGIVKMSEKAKAGTIVLEASNGEGVSLCKQVEVKNSLRGTAAYIPNFPAPEEVKPIFIPMQTVFTDTMLVWIRAIAIGIVSILIIAYVIFYHKAIKERKEEI